MGWGGIPQAFDERNAAWADEYRELKYTLTPEEYEMARASTLNAHYTSPTVIRAIYSAVEQMGFRTGNILEILTTSLIQPYPVQRNWQQTGYKRILLATETAKAAFFMDIKKPPIFSTGGAMLRLESRYHF